MTAIPAGILTFFVVLMAGGPMGFLRTIERTLQGMVDWFLKLLA